MKITAILVAALVVTVSALEKQLPTLTDLLNDDNLLQQFRQWQLSMQPHNNVEEQAPTRNYGGNPWLQPQPQPQPIPPPTASPSRPPPYGEQPGNPWYQPPVQPQPDPYPQPAPQPIPQPLPYPPVTSPPIYPPAAVNPPPSPEVEAIRRYCLKPRGQFAARSCNRYVNCWDDTILEQECPAGLLFSEKGYCDYDFNVDCAGRTVGNVGVTPTPTLPEGSKHCPTPFGNYRNAANCSEFFICSHGAPVKFCCPAGLYYSTELGVCDYPYNVDCINPRPLYPQPVPQPQPQPYPTDPVWNPYYLQRIPADLLNEKKSCVPNSVYRLNSDCSSVAICRSGKTEVINCGHNTGFNADQGLCVARHLAKC